MAQYQKIQLYNYSFKKTLGKLMTKAVNNKIKM